MHEPMQAVLMRGVIDALEAEVVPALEAGAAQRQLKAAIVILRRMERAADREGAYLATDADDTAKTLWRALAGAGDEAAAELTARLATVMAGSTVLTDLAVARARDTRLQELAVDVEAYLRGRDDPEGAAELRRLHHRMLERQDQAWGTARAPS